MWVSNSSGILSVAASGLKNKEKSQLLNQVPYWKISDVSEEDFGEWTIKTLFLKPEGQKEASATGSHMYKSTEV